LLVLGADVEYWMAFSTQMGSLAMASSVTRLSDT
jgi:hypothetical protein